MMGKFLADDKNFKGWLMVADVYPLYMYPLYMYPYLIGKSCHVLIMMWYNRHTKKFLL